MRALETSFFILTQVAFWVGQDAENEFKVTCEPLKHRFFDFTEVAFWVGQEEVNESPVIGDHLKHRFPTSPKSNFVLVNRQKMTFNYHSAT